MQETEHGIFIPKTLKGRDVIRLVPQAMSRAAELLGVSVADIRVDIALGRQLGGYAAIGTASSLLAWPRPVPDPE